MNKKILCILSATVLSLSMVSCSSLNLNNDDASAIVHKKDAVSDQKTEVSDYADEETLYQYSTYNAFSQGTFEGLTPAKDFLTYGDTGLGYADGLDGAIIVVDGTAYHITSDGVAKECDKNDKIAYGAVTKLNSSKTQSILEIKGIKNFCNALSNQIILNQLNIAKIDGTFSSLKLTCPKAQSEPYKSYKTASKDNVNNSYKDIKGTIIAVYYPEFYDGIGQKGWNMFFISEDKSKGGIVTDVHIKEGKCIIEKTSKFALETPQTDSFNKLTLEAGIDSDTDDEKTDIDNSSQSDEQ